MELKITKTQNGTHSLPDSIKRNLPLASYEHYESMQVRSIKDIMDRKNDILNLRQIIEYKENGNEVVVSMFVKSLNTIKEMTGVKKWITPEGVKLFIDEVINRYAKKDITHIQLNPVDIMLFARKVSTGEYGEMYESITVPKLLSWLDEYVYERTTYVLEEKKNKEINRYKTEEKDIDPEGLKKESKAFAKVHKKYISSKIKKRRRYISAQDYIKRNNVDEGKFWDERKEEYEKWIVNVVQSSDAMSGVEDLTDDEVKAFKRMYINKWLFDQNELLNENFNKSNNAK